MMRFLLVSIKLLVRRFRPIPEFCKHCGRDVHGFIAPDCIWEQIDPHIRRGHILCYDCFCELSDKLGLPSVYRLEELDK